MTRGAVGHVLFRIAGRRSIRRDVGTEEGEVSGVARPHPVVGLSSVLPDGTWRCVDEAHVVQDSAPDPTPFPPLEVGHHDCARVRPLGLLLETPPLVLDRLPTGSRIGTGGVGSILDQGGDILIAPHETHRVAGCGNLLREVLGEEAVLEVVVLDTTDCVDRTESAVVVGDDQPLLRDEARAAPVDLHRGRKQAGFAVPDLLGGKLETTFGESSEIEVLQLFRQPLTFVRLDTAMDQGEGQDGRTDGKEDAQGGEVLHAPPL